MGDTVDGIEWARSHWPEEDWPDWPDWPDADSDLDHSSRWSRRRLRLVALIVVAAMLLAAILPAVFSALRRPAVEEAPAPEFTTLQDFLPRNVFNGVT